MHALQESQRETAWFVLVACSFAPGLIYLPSQHLHTWRCRVVKESPPDVNDRATDTLFAEVEKLLQKTEKNSPFR